VNNLKLAIDIVDVVSPCPSLPAIDAIPVVIGDCIVKIWIAVDMTASGVTTITNE
jgi:hypothetical protein